MEVVKWDKDRVCLRCLFFFGAGDGSEMRCVWKRRGKAEMKIVNIEEASPFA